MNDTLIDRVAWIGAPNTTPRGIVLTFVGLGSTGMKDTPSEQEQRWIDSGALVVQPYYGPWSWMNDATVEFVDELVDGLRWRYGLGADTPLIATGGSMGGFAVLAYAMATTLGVTACFANCPVCDLPFHYTERPDLPRTMHHAFGSYGDITATLEAHSPLHQPDRLPDVPYLIVHGTEDKSVGKARHSDPLVAAMVALKRNVEYIAVPGMGHCGPLPDALVAKIDAFVVEQLGAI
ncbi:MAG TPA: prolyl oligopeptidase family serine peptidase [Capsulimonadaceae bacterium]|jgi:dipeptidyl aminopeptidase/acylaminoacyl peptidase